MAENNFKTAFLEYRERIWAKKRQRVRLHRSFRRSYREDYVRPLKAPGLLHFSVIVMKTIFENKKLFFSLIMTVVLLNTLLVGIMSEETYTAFQTALDDTNTAMDGDKLGVTAKAGLLLVSTVVTGGLTDGMSEVQQILVILIFLIVWLVTIYLIRHIMAGHKPKLRDGMYNALAPLISTLMVFVVVFIYCMPAIAVVVAYSAAVSTNFLSTPFYCFVFFVPATLLIVFAVYLLSGALVALAAVTAPGIYPMRALMVASDLIAGRRIRLIIRLLFLLFVIAVLWVIVMLPIILLDMWLKSMVDWVGGWPIVPFFLVVMTCFSVVYLSAYIYMFYRRLIDDTD
jgi:hypothetical protein